MKFYVVLADVFCWTLRTSSWKPLVIGLTMRRLLGMRFHFTIRLRIILL